MSNQKRCWRFPRCQLRMVHREKILTWRSKTQMSILVSNLSSVSNASTPVLSCPTDIQEKKCRSYFGDHALSMIVAILTDKQQLHRSRGSQLSKHGGYYNRQTIYNRDYKTAGYLPVHCVSTQVVMQQISCKRVEMRHH